MRLAGEVLSLLPNYLRVYVRARAQERGEARVYASSLGDLYMTMTQMCCTARSKAVHCSGVDATLFERCTCPTAFTNASDQECCAKARQRYSGSKLSCLTLDIQKT